MCLNIFKTIVQRYSMGYLNDDVWNEIKTYRFHRHLWNTVNTTKFNKVIKQLPKLGSSPSVFNYYKRPSSSSSVIVYDIIKIYEYITWKTHKINLITFVYIPKFEEDDTFILNELLLM